MMLSIRREDVKKEIVNANVSISVMDGIFMNYWLERFDELIIDSSDVFSYAGGIFYTKLPVNVTYVRRDVRVNLN